MKPIEAKAASNENLTYNFEVLAKCSFHDNICDSPTTCIKEVTHLK